jgi:outer membrane protein assembly factor BamD
MNHRMVLWLAVSLMVVAFPYRSPAPLVYHPEEGWVYEKPGGDTKWQRSTAKEQLRVAQEAYDKKDYDLASKAAKRVVSRWPFADYAAPAQYLTGRCLEAQGKDEAAFKQYQKLLEKYPKMTNSQEVLERQFIIANKFLGGEWRRLWGYIPIPPSMDSTVDMYQKVIKNAPYSDVAPQAQMNIGLARERQKNYAEAVKAYELAADKYSEQEKVTAEALYKAGMATLKESKTAEYDQNAAGRAINTFTDFSTLYPDDRRVKNAQKCIEELKTEQARGSYDIARFYEKKKKWRAALIYYNEVLLKDPNSVYAKDARDRLVQLRKYIEDAPPKTAATPSDKAAQKPPVKPADSGATNKADQATEKK